MEEPLDFANICRVCLSNKNTVVSVFKRDISKKLMACAAVQVWPKDGLPAQICKLCVAKLNTSYLFRQQCEKSDEKLRHIANINKSFEENEQAELEECQIENQEIVNDNNSTGFVFVDCDPLGEVSSGETMISEYSFSLTEPPPLVAIANTVRLTTPIKLEDHIVSCTEEDLLPSSKNQAVTSLDNEVPVIPVVKKMRREECSNAFTELLTLPDCGNETLKFTSLANETHILHTSQQSIKNQQQGNLISFNKKEETLNTTKTREYNINNTYEKTYSCSSDSYKCNVCYKIFSDSRKYNLHVSSHTNKKQFMCCICNATYQTEEGLGNHVNIHTGFAAQENLHASEKNNICNLCNKSLGLNDHIKKNNKEKFICETCDQPFANPKQLKDHSLEHSDVRPFACTLCEKTFSAIKYLTIHVKKHCPLASKLEDSNLNNTRNKKKEEEVSFRNVQNKRSTKIVNIPNKIFQCNLCDLQFLNDEGLILHKKQHNKESDPRCPVCDKPFVTNADLKDHCAIHAQDKPFGCTKCDKRFSTQNNLNKHDKTHVK